MYWYLALLIKSVLKKGKKNIALSNLSAYYTWRSTKKLYNNNKFKISVLTWNDEFEIPDESYLISDIQDYFEYIFRKHGERKY